MIKQAGSITSRNNELGVIKRDRSYTNEMPEEAKQRERSISNISQKQVSKTIQNSQQSSVRSTINSNQITQITAQANKDMLVKKVSVIVNLTKSGGSQGKLTPRKQNNVQTPRQEKKNHDYKRSFCQTEDEGSVVGT